MRGDFDWHLENWMRWCRCKDWMPMGHISQLATMMKHAKQAAPTSTDAVTPLYEQEAQAFNQLVSMLPRRHMTVFLLNHLDKGILGHRIVYTKNAGIKYKLAGLSRTTFYDRAKEADNMIKRWMA